MILGSQAKLHADLQPRRSGGERHAVKTGRIDARNIAFAMQVAWCRQVQLKRPEARKGVDADHRQAAVVRPSAAGATMARLDSSARAYSCRPNAWCPESQVSTAAE
jgi:hypothetical protein